MPDKLCAKAGNRRQGDKRKRVVKLVLNRGVPYIKIGRL